jgi:hypothetical protein
MQTYVAAEFVYRGYTCGTLFYVQDTIPIIRISLNRKWPPSFLISAPIKYDTDHPAGVFKNELDWHLATDLGGASNG